MVSLCKKGNTSILWEAGRMTVRFHNTDIVRISEHTVIFDSGGWRTVTTKQRMNQAMRESNIPIYVYQKDFNWFIAFTNSKKPDIPFVDNMIIRRLASL